MSANVVRFGPREPGGVDAGSDDRRLEGIRALGYDHETCFYLSPTRQQILAFAAGEHTAANLCLLRGLDWWRETFPTKRQNQEFDVAEARKCLMEACDRAGPYDPELVRGRGVWWDEALGAIVHEGAWVHVGKAAYRPSEAPPGYVYEAAASLPSLVGLEPLEEGEGQLLLDVCEAMHWLNPRSAELLAGWLVVAPVCGAMRWRPHMWVTGPAGAGKTWVIQNVCLPVLGPLAIAVEGETTEAGIRQTLGSDARPICFDEAEAEKKSGQQRIQRVLAMARYMSSSGGNKVLKGGSGGQAASFAGASSFLLGSINVALSRQADETRFTVVELAKNTGVEAAEHFKLLRQLAARLDDRFRRRLLAATVANLATLRLNHERLAAAIGKRFGQRLGDQIGAILAGAALLRSFEPLSEAEAAALAEDLPVPEEQLAHIETDQERCLAQIASIWVRVDTSGGKRQVTRTIGDLVALRLGKQHDDELGSREVDMALGRHGIVVRPLEEARKRIAAGEQVPPSWAAFVAGNSHAVFVANRHPRLADILANSDFGDSWARVLLRLDGAVPSPFAVRFGPGVQQRGTVLPPDAWWRESGTNAGTNAKSVPPTVPGQPHGT